MSETIAFGMGLMLMLVLLRGGAYQWGWTRAIAESRKLRHRGVELDDWHAPSFWRIRLDEILARVLGLSDISVARMITCWSRALLGVGGAPNESRPAPPAAPGSKHRRVS